MSCAACPPRGPRCNTPLHEAAWQESGGLRRFGTIPRDELLVAARLAAKRLEEMRSWDAYGYGYGYGCGYGWDSHTSYGYGLGVKDMEGMGW